MRTLLQFLLIIILFSESTYCQKYKKPIDYRFKGGEAGYSAFFSKSATYPQASVKAGTIGNSITRISINPDGEINGIVIINPVDSNIDSMVLLIIDQSGKNWKKCDSIKHDQVFYIQIIFSLPGFYPIMFEPKSRELVALFPVPIRIALPEPLLATLSKENEGRIWSVKNEELTSKADLYLDSAKYEKALPYINELQSLMDDDLNSAGFTVKNSANETLSYKKIVYQQDSHTKFLKYHGFLGIAYYSKQPTSYVNFLKESVFFDANGYFEPYGISWEGEMSRDRIADMLPYDYSGR